ncbi:MAG TPA: radical SAM protein [Bacteroidales bacterium]|nr:radical SAM protein [Bacteroidales bacterium]
MYDHFNRRINYLRISVTDRCNLRCRYCMPEHGVELLRHQDILSLEEIFEVAKVATDFGVDKVRLTGGEPLVRKGVTRLITMLSQLKTINDLSLTTNATLLSQFTQPLVEAGLHRINISLDTINPEKYKEITRGGDISTVFRGIEAAQKAGLNPIKINCVVKNSSDEEDAVQISNFCRQHQLQVRFIHQMNLKTGEFSKVEGGSGGDCSHCNRIRLTANGKLKPCLFNDFEFDVRKLGAKDAFLKAVEFKPKNGTTNKHGHFYTIGG